MSYAIRAAISVLAGMGAGLVGYWVAWRFLDESAGERLVAGFSPWMLVAIFAPGILVTLAVFWTTGPKEDASDSAKAPQSKA